MLFSPLFYKDVIQNNNGFRDIICLFILYSTYIYSVKNCSIYLNILYLNLDTLIQFYINHIQKIINT